MDRTNYVLFMCRDFLNDIQENNDGGDDYSHRPYFYSEIIHHNIDKIDLSKKLDDKTVLEYIKCIYDQTNIRTEMSLDNKIYTMHDAYGGNDSIQGYIASLFYLQQLKIKLNF